MSFFTELKRRNVFKVAAAYIIVAWLIMQVGEVMAPALHLPDWVDSFLAFILILGFPIALVCSWAFELTADGLKLEKNVDRSQSITGLTGRRLDFWIIGLLAVALGYFAWDKFVTREGPETDSQDQATRVATPELESDGVISGHNAIAVLPFANRSALESDLYFTDGIHDDLLTQLSKVSGLKVISRTSVMQYRDAPPSIPEIAAELGVSHVLEGGVQRAGDRIRMNAQLIDVATDEHLWAEIYDRELTVDNLFDIQSELASQIVRAVRGELTPEESEHLAAQPTQNLAAYEAFLHARAAYNEGEYSADKYLRTAEWSEQAVALDPAFSWAWALLADARLQLIWYGHDASPELFTTGKEALDKAIELDPDSGWTKTALGEYHYRVEADYLAALEAFDEALTDQPGSADIMGRKATTERRVGRLEAAITTFEKALEYDPGNRFLWSSFVETLIFNQRYEKAYQVLQEALALFPHSAELMTPKGLLHIHWRGDLAAARDVLDEVSPSPVPLWMFLATEVPLYERDYEEVIRTWNLPEAIEFDRYGHGSAGWRGRWLGEVLLLQGKTEAAHASLRTFIETSGKYQSKVPRNQFSKLSSLAVAHALQGEHHQALDLSRQALKIVHTTRDGFEGGFSEAMHARVLALAGNDQEAIEQLRVAMDLNGTLLTPWILRLDPRWDFMRDHPGFQELVR